MNRILFGLLLVLTALPLPALGAGESVAVVLSATGTVVATGEAAESRPLRRRSELFVGDVIRTGDNARAQIRFRDGEVIALHPDTELRIDAFHLDEAAPEQSRSVKSLVSGGMRAITGTIGGDQYTVETSAATIGIRGTMFSLQLEGDTLFAGVSRGRILVRNDAGEILLGNDQPYRFAVVPGAGVPPRGTLQPPPQLLGNDADGAVDEAEGADGDGTADEASESGDGTVTEDDPALVQLDTDLASADDLVSGLSSTPGMELLLDPFSSLLDDQPIRAPGSVTPLSHEALVAYRFSAEALPSVSQLQVFRDDNDQLLFGVVFDGEVDGEPVYVSWMLRPGEAETGAQHFNEPLNVGWGVWNASPDTPASWDYEMLEGEELVSESLPVESPLYWMAYESTDPSVLADWAGESIYGGVGNVLGFLGGSATGQIGWGSDGELCALSVTVDFTSGTFNGHMDLLFSGGTHLESWLVDFGGDVIGATLEAYDVSGIYTQLDGPLSGTVDGDVLMNFVGAEAEAIAGSYALWAHDGGSIISTTEGVFLIQEAQ